MVTVLFLITAAATVALCASEPSAEPRTFESLLDEAAEAHREGRLSEARARLRDAARLASPQEFHGLLLEAGDEYDRGRLRTSRRRLKRATQILNPWFWFGLGLVAQGFFTARFVVQWLASERKGKSVVPLAFWYLSLLGSSGLLVYAIWRQDPIIILGQSFNSFVYVRNLIFISHARRREAAAVAPGNGGQNP